MQNHILISFCAACLVCSYILYTMRLCLMEAEQYTDGPCTQRTTRQVMVVMMADA
jgi:hypothetical protein